MPDEKDMSAAAAAAREFINRSTNRFRDGLEAMLAERGDTFAFPFSLSDVPDWPLRAEAVLAGMQGDAPMTLIVLIRPKDAADAFLDAMTALRGGMVVEQEQALDATLGQGGA